ncbi:MAG: cytochrome c-type biogenesis protein CcmH [Anaerolineae bacterium]
MIKRVLLIVALACLMLPLGAAQAQDDLPTEPDDTAITDDQVNAIARELYCPVCENIPLDVCGTQACADWRQEIRTMLAEGRSEAEIKGYFADRYGRRVLATPDATGIDAVAWAFPIVAVTIGVVGLVVVVRRMTVTTQTVVNYDGLDPEYVARIEADLKEMAAS